MNKLTRVIIIIILMIMATSVKAEAKTITYDRFLAIDYADRYCGVKPGVQYDETMPSYNFADYKCWNAKCVNCENYNTGYWKDGKWHWNTKDCANFVSQCLIAGGISFDNYPLSSPIGNGNRRKGYPGVSRLVPTLTNGYCFESRFIDKTLVAKEGDVLVSTSGSHVTIYAGDNKYYGHTNDRYLANAPWTTVYLLHFNDEEKCKKCEQDEKTKIASLIDKNTKCETCDPTTGEVKPKYPEWFAGRCSPRFNCDPNTGLLVASAGGDCPDDTLTVGTGVTPQPAPSTNQNAAVGILESGFSYDVVNLLKYFNQGARVLKPGDISPDPASSISLLIIPSGGLSGLDKSDFFRTALSEYVKSGGNLLVLTQQHGYEFGALPGGPEGYGWVEDMSCQTNSSYIDTWHTVLSGQTRTTPSLNVDGYFTKYPEDATVLLRRTANGQPAVLMYQYGQGKVIAATIYTDTACTRV